MPKNPRISRNELMAKEENSSPRSKKNLASAPYNKSALGMHVKIRRLPLNQQMPKKLESEEEQENMSSGTDDKSLSLTPSSSDISLAGVAKVVDQKEPKDQPDSDAKSKLLASKTITLPPYLTLKRQPTAAMISFRARKSVSQIDFKEARRTGNYQVVLSSSQVLVPAAKQTTQLSIENKDLGELLLRDAAAQICDKGQGNLRFVISGDQDVRMASLRIFNTIMLRSWRRRREEVRQLIEQLEDTKRSFVKNRNQLHVYNTLFAVEKRRNDTLNDQLKLSYVECAKMKLSYNELSVMLSRANEEKEQLAKDNAAKSVEIENLQEQLQEAKRELLAANTLQREQLEQVARFQLECKDARDDILELTNQLHSLKEELTEKQKYVEKLRDNISNIADQLKVSSDGLQEYKKETEANIGKLMKHAAELEKETKEKEELVATLQSCLAATLGQRIRHCFAQSRPYQQATCQLMHLVAYCILPGTPPPSLPMSTIPCAISKLKGLFQGGSAGGSSDKELEDKKKE